MAGRLSLDELERRSQTPVESLAQWRALGLIGSEGEGTFGEQDLQRARLIHLLLRRGVNLDSLVRVERTEPFLDRYLGYLSEHGEGAPRYSLAQVAERVGLDRGIVQRFFEAAGLVGTGEAFSDDDVGLLGGTKVILESGLPQEALVQLLRVYSEALARVAEAEIRLFHFYVHERLRAEGVSGRDLPAATDVARARMMPFIEPTILYFHRKGFASAVADDALLHLQEGTGLMAPGQLRLAMVFVDLASFTPLTEIMGDEAAAKVLERFSQLVHDAVSRHDGRAVKQMGDAFMLAFREVGSAVACALEIERLSVAEPEFPAVRAGVQWGDVLYREGDYVGANVNTAARLADAAERHQVLVTAAVKERAETVPHVEFVPVGRRVLKGMTEGLDLFEVRGAMDQKTRRVVDPVCGIEVEPERAVARLVFDGLERFFCCQLCLQRFVEAPERWTPR